MGLLSRALTSLRNLRLRSHGRPLDPGEEEEVFQERYHNLRLLLAANKKALDLMAEMERAAQGEAVFGMTFVRSRCTSVGVSVFRMIRCLDALAPDRYRGLARRFEGIEEAIREILEAVPSDREAVPLVLPLGEVDSSMVDAVGAKMANLGEVLNVVGLPCPDGFVLTSTAYRRFLEGNDLQSEVDRLIQSSSADRVDEIYALSSQIQQRILEAEIPVELEAAADRAFSDLCERVGFVPTVALRSSALGEDTETASFAGQYRSQLNVRREHLLDAYKDVVASKYTPQAMHYRLERGLRDELMAMCVGCLVMVPARIGGVAYTGNPRDRRDTDIHISAAWGLPKSVVDGRFESDELVLRRGQPVRVVRHRAATTEVKLVCDPGEGVTRAALDPAEQGVAPLDEGKAAAIAKAALQLEEHFGAPQDIEWAIAKDDRVVILQCRPLMQLSPPAAMATVGGDVLVSGGVCASPGVAGGVVHWVRRDPDALAFPKGGVLVVAQPLPAWAALLGRAAAVIAAEGGFAGHLATVARELRVPALFRLGDAAGALRDGAVVTVNATGLAVYNGEVPELLRGEDTKPRLMIGSPVHKTLLETLDRVTPLNLLDPDGLDFRPESCQTLHDITRFCHEQAVREMFDFGKDRHFPRHASRQLHYKVPMQWWVLNLEDGFAGEEHGRYVGLEDIVCIPMLAVWNGMIAIPWEGPPALSGRGLAAVMFEATANPALATPFRKPYANQNYFMISKHFMNLQSRFGFHLCGVEALVSERVEENYASFSFKGGAADLERRQARVRLLAGILEEQGFRMAIHGDSATARVGGLEQDGMEARLRMIGYLLMHTRQLDMIMGDPAAVRYYTDKIRADCTRLLLD